MDRHTPPCQALVVGLSQEGASQCPPFGKPDIFEDASQLEAA